MTERYFKVLAADGSPVNGGQGRWKLPRGKRPGAWMPPVAEPKTCERGYHLTDAAHLALWIKADAAVYEAEGRGAEDAQADKTAFAEARLLRLVGIADEKALRLFAADCAEHVLPLYEKRYPDDAGPREAIAAARRFARGEITEAEMRVKRNAASDAAASDAAARAAAYAAARAAAYAAARAAAYAAAADAAYAAAAAAHAAAYAAAAAAAAAYAAERTWQVARLSDYLHGRVQS